LEYKNKKLSEFDDTATEESKKLGQQIIDIKNIYNFQYYGPIYMGSSAKEMYVSYDTGSDVRISKWLINISGW
jgi:hypothetical protein